MKAQRVLNPALSATSLQPPVLNNIANGDVHDKHARMGIKISIPEYHNVEMGDHIQLLWGNVVQPGRSVRVQDLGKPQLMAFHLGYEDIAVHGDGPVQVRYKVTRCGQEHLSLPLDLTLVLHLPGPQDPMPHTLVNEALAAPLVKGKRRDHPPHNNYLDAENSRLGADAIIAWHEDFAVGDHINLNWGHDAPLIHRITREDVENADDLVIWVPNSVITRQGCGPRIPVFYDVTRVDSPNVSTSPVQDVTVIFSSQLPGGDSGLAAPVFANADGQNIIRPGDDPQGTSVFIAPWRNMNMGDLLVLVFCGFDAKVGGDPVTAAALEKEWRMTEQDVLYGCYLTIPNANLSAIGEGRAEVRYRVLGNPGEATSLKADAYVGAPLTSHR
jgi:hypothetical protein